MHNCVCTDVSECKPHYLVHFKYVAPRYSVNESNCDGLFHERKGRKNERHDATDLYHKLDDTLPIQSDM